MTQPQDKLIENFTGGKIAHVRKDENTHPLLNPESSHYAMVDDVEAIERMEQMYSIEELMAWAKLSAMKYRLRISSKEKDGSMEEGVRSDASKIVSFEAYYTYLKAGNIPKAKSK